MLTKTSAEIFPLGIRSVCLVATTCSQWLGQFIVVYSTPYMMGNIKFGTFLLFAGFILLGGVFAFLLIPETAGLSLEDMDVLFSIKGLAGKKRPALEASLATRREEDQIKQDKGDEEKQEELNNLSKDANPTSNHVESA